MLPMPDLVDQVAGLYTLLGHQVERIIERNNQVFDLATKASNGERWIIRCVDDTIVDRDILTEFLPVLTAEKAKHAAIVATGLFSPELRQMVKGKRIDLLDHKEFLACVEYVRGATTVSNQSQEPMLRPRSTKPPITSRAHPTGLKKCPYCAEAIQKEAVVCRFCGRNLRLPQNRHATIPPSAANVPQRSTYQTGSSSAGFFLLLIILCIVVFLSVSQIGRTSQGIQNIPDAKSTTLSSEVVNISNGSVKPGTQVRIDVAEGLEDIPVNLFRENSTRIECSVRQGSYVIIMGYGNRLYIGGQTAKQPKVQPLGSSCIGVLSPDWLVK